MTDPIKAEPVAWKVQAPDSHYFELRHFPMGGLLIENGWTEAPLYTAAQLDEERRLAWNEAIEAAAGSICGLVVKHAKDAVVADVADKLGQIIRALTKDSTHD